MTISRTRNGYLKFGGEAKQKRKLTRRKRTRMQRGEGAFLGPILARSIALGKNYWKKFSE